MSEGRRRLLIATFPTAAVWLLLAWLAHDPRSWAITLTDAIFVIGLAFLYLSAWGLVAALRPSQPARAIGLRAAATALVLLALWALAELPAALGLLDYSRLLSVLGGEWSGPASSFVADPDLAWARPPRSRWSGRPRSDMAVAFNLGIRAPSAQSFTTDSRGFRNRRELDRADVVLLGDSYVEGAYVSDDETMAVALEPLIKAPVANLGRSGYGTLQERLVLERHALPLRPRAVFWFFFEGNDLYDDQEFENAMVYLRAHGSYGNPGGRVQSLKRLREASLTANTFRLLRRAVDPLVPASAPTFGWFRGEPGVLEKMYFYRDAALHFEDFERERLGKAQEAFRSGAALCREQGVKLLLVFIPMKFRVYGPFCSFPALSPCREWRMWDLDARFRSLCQAEQIPFLDLTAPMSAAAAAGRLLYAPEDSHWNAPGHRFVAEHIAAALAER